METTTQTTTTASEQTAQAAEYRERMAWAADYIELVWRYQGTEREQTELAAFHADNRLARTVGEFGALLLTRHLTVVLDGHADCEAGYVMDKLAAVTSREFMRRCLAGEGAEAAWSAARFLIECMEEVDQVSEFLADVRGDVATGWPATA
ncbi:hypothetical protein [Streptomyces bikiniensis]|uniref:hypothetical protein n=1 Tax=Streptomyces bikiniensis TaxID=1896 RepID=UPI001F1B3E3D|nr:hypothetical protein [Streptomyces bikiniensis]